jgi:hypothetical protein
MSLISHTLGFYESEARLFHGGRAAFLVAMSQKADAEMARLGGIKPFSYECYPELFGLNGFKVSEIGKALRTDAQRALVKVRANQRKPQGRRTSPRRGRSA